MKVALTSPDLPRQMVRLADMARLAPERRKKALGICIREVERQAKKIATRAGVFKTGAGKLSQSLRGRVFSTTTAGLTVGVAYGLIQDHGGQTKPHRIEPKHAKVLAWRVGAGSPFANAMRFGKGKARGTSARNVKLARSRMAAGKNVTGMYFHWPKGAGVNHPGSRIPATNYSWKAYLASRTYMQEQTRLAALGRVT